MFADLDGPTNFRRTVASLHCGRRLLTAVEERLRTALGAGYAAARAEGESRSVKEALATAREALTLALGPLPAG